MLTTRDHKLTTIERIQREPEFGVALIAEAAELIATGEADVAKLVLRDVVQATVGFEGLAKQTGKNSKSLHRMLSLNGNPTIENISLIFKVLRSALEDASKAAIKAA